MINADKSKLKIKFTFHKIVQNFNFSLAVWISFPSTHVRDMITENYSDTSANEDNSFRNHIR